jgi:hypothetical protein
VRTGNFGRWDTNKPDSALVQFGAGGASANGAVSRKCTPSPAPFLSPLMDIPREFMPQSFDRFQYTLKDLDPADPDWAEQVEEEKGERDMDFERNEPK